MNLSKSKYCSGIQCKKILWLDKNMPEVRVETASESVLENGTEVGELAKQLFGEYIDIEFNSNLNNMINDTKKALKNDKCIITEASFNYDNNFCSVDILKKDGNNYEIYEVKSSTHVTEVYLNDISYQVYVLKSLGYNVVKASIVYINNKYVRNGKLELNKLFNIKDVTKDSLSRQDMVKENIDSIRLYMKNTNEPIENLDIKCSEPYPCPFFNYCSRNLPKDNIFNIRSLRKSTMYKLYNEGIYKYEDLLNTNINDKYKEQIEFELYDKEDYIDKKSIKKFMDTLSYPLYFLDFESCQQSIPMYDGVSPYMQIPFQYSLHYILEEDKNIEHKEFLAIHDIDPRRKLAEQLVNDIPKDVCVLAYNMSFEKTVIKKLASIYPDLSEHLLNIHDNIKDLMIPFYKRYYYSKGMHGSYSIKYVLPALFPDDPSLNYHNLDLVHNGSEASNTYMQLGKMDEKSREEARYNLLKYCELDTYAMVKIWQKLKEI